jgi:hypothetical protein
VRSHEQNPGETAQPQMPVMTMPTSNEFSVCQFFQDGTYEYVRRFVSAEEAVNAVAHFRDSVAVKTGLVTRVIITDGGDNCCLEWQQGKGIVFPTKDQP